VGRGSEHPGRLVYRGSELSHVGRGSEHPWRLVYRDSELSHVGRQFRDIGGYIGPGQFGAVGQ